MNKFMSTKSYLRLVGVLFYLVGLLHLLRFSLGWQVQFNGWAVPFWVSPVAFVAAMLLGSQAVRLGKSM